MTYSIGDYKFYGWPFKYRYIVWWHDGKSGYKHHVNPHGYYDGFIFGDKFTIGIKRQIFSPSLFSEPLKRQYTTIADCHFKSSVKYD